jgi:hypothetical protein
MKPDSQTAMKPRLRIPSVLCAPVAFKVKPHDSHVSIHARDRATTHGRGYASPVPDYPHEGEVSNRSWFSMNDPLLEHLTRHAGPVTAVFEEIVAGDPKIDIIHIGSSFLRRYELLVTRGMSARPMAVPPESEEPRFAELLTLLPKGWPVRQSAFGEENNYWPIRLLKTLARHPFEAGAWLGYGHTHANGDSEATLKPYAQNTELCAVVILPSVTLGERAWSYRRPDGQEVFLWAAVPLFPSELKFKLTNGLDALLELLERGRVSDIVKPTRKRVV